MRAPRKDPKPRTIKFGNLTLADNCQENTKAIQRWRKLIGREGELLSDMEVEEVRNLFLTFADALLDELATDTKRAA